MPDPRDNPLTLDGQVAVVTGAGRGLGRAHALALAERGALVVVNDPGAALDGAGGSAGPAGEVVAEIEAAGGTAVADTTDISSPAGGAAVIARALESFGRIDIVVNNAGILRDGAFHKLDEERLRAVIDVHLLGSIWVTHAAWPHLREQSYGRVINTTSVAGYLGNFGQANYGAAKAGLIGLTRVLAIEGARHDIRVNAIAPGARTRMTEELLGANADRLDPSLVSAVVVLLAHRDCPVTGEVFQAAGGRVARVFVAQSQGFFDGELSPESLREHWDAVMDCERPETPADVAAELALIARHFT